MRNKLKYVLLIVVFIFCLSFLCACKGKDEEKKLSPEESAKATVQAFYDKYYSGNVEEAVGLIDLAGVEVYNEQNGELDNYKELYNIYIESEDWSKYKTQIEKSWDGVIKDSKESMEGTQIPKVELSDFQIENVSKDVYRVVVNINEINNSGDVIESGKLEHYVFKNNNGEYKIIYVEE